jgi:hypothetical protein
MEKLPHYYFSWIVSFQNRDKFELLPLETKQFGGILLPHSDFGGWRVFLEETPRSRRIIFTCCAGKRYSHMVASVAKSLYV